MIIPTDRYLEAPGGPVPFRNVEWIDVSTKLVKGGVAGRPRELIEVKGELLEGLRGTTLTWELRASTWGSPPGLVGGSRLELHRVKVDS